MTLQVEGVPTPVPAAAGGQPVLFAVVGTDGSISALSSAVAGGGWPALPAPRALPELVAQQDRAAVEALLAQVSAGQVEAELVALPGRPQVCLSLSAPMVGAAGVLRVAVAHDLQAMQLWEERAQARYGVDPVTGLMTRGLLLTRYPAFVAAARRVPRSVTAAVFLDVDGLKAVNDRHGHAAGDAVLGDLGQQLRGLVRPGDLAARVGGDEMVVLMGGLPGASSLDKVVHRVRSAVVTRQGLPRGAGAVTCSVGATDFGLGEGLEAVLARADAAMYLAKRARPGAVPRELRCPACSSGGRGR